jgi:hypothetical protein
MSTGVLSTALSLRRARAVATCCATNSTRDPGFDGVTVQWFENMDAYRAHMAEPDFSALWQDIESFLDTGQLHFVVTEEPHVVMGDPGPFPLA